MYKYKIQAQLSIHSFDHYQVSVVTMLDKKNDIHNGIAVLPAPDTMFNEMSSVTGNFDQPLAINHRQALLLCRFIREVTSGSLPKKIDLETSGPTLRIVFKKFVQNWPGNGGYKGRVSFNKLFFFSPFSKVTIARNSLLALRRSLINLYQLESMEPMDA